MVVALEQGRRRLQYRRLQSSAPAGYLGRCLGIQAAWIADCCCCPAAGSPSPKRSSPRVLGYGSRCEGGWHLSALTR